MIKRAYPLLVRNILPSIYVRIFSFLENLSQNKVFHLYIYMKNRVLSFQFLIFSIDLKHLLKLYFCFCNKSSLWRLIYTPIKFYGLVAILNICDVCNMNKFNFIFDSLCILFPVVVSLQPQGLKQIIFNILYYNI